jgi:lipopolysaccharide biosynthesis protein
MLRPSLIVLHFQGHIMLDVLRYFIRQPKKVIRLLLTGIVPASLHGSGVRLPTHRDRYRHLVRIAESSQQQLKDRVPTASRLAREPVSARTVTKPVPRFSGTAITQASPKLICFYLPQFHPIPENDQWWGSGFTEWSNVRPATPLFEGHYQPHVPGDLGYYNLLQPGTQKQQVELAKLYGVGGFCFYFYWFGGKRLLEEPVLNYLRDQSLDLPFCLCWANENWTRRWDGLDSEILMQQRHSSEDDIAFISHISQYLRDPRYLRIEGRPMIVVYRPNLLPSPRETAERWRLWCRQQGLGEIHLAYTQSFETVDPAEYGFDSAIEFPPNNSAPPRVSPEGLRNDFEGSVFDWSVFPERSKNYASPMYQLFRGVNPSWDNTARKKNRSTIFINSSPAGYQEWLVNAIVETRARSSGDDRQLIFINAWNEWAEGAHLEPDERHGYAFLEATRVARVRAEVVSLYRSRAQVGALAVIIHAFYIDVFRDFVEQLRAVLPMFECPIALYVSTTSQLEADVRSACESLCVEFGVFVVPNRGRDVLPFLQILRSIDLKRFDLVLKLHTKKSPHRPDGDVWRADVCSKLLCADVVGCVREFFETNPAVGFVGPHGYVVPVSEYWGSNERHILDLAMRLGVASVDLESLRFIAGTMFYCRVSALAPLMGIELGPACFEEEAGQIDGTLAHAVERGFALSARSVGMTIASTADLEAGVSRGRSTGLTLSRFYKPSRASSFLSWLRR